MRPNAMRPGRGPRFSADLDWIDADFGILRLVDISRAAAAMLHSLLASVTSTVYPMTVGQPGDVHDIELSVVMLSVIEFDLAE